MEKHSLFFSEWVDSLPPHEQKITWFFINTNGMQRVLTAWQKNGEKPTRIPPAWDFTPKQQKTPQHPLRLQLLNHYLVGHAQDTWRRYHYRLVRRRKGVKNVRGMSLKPFKYIAISDGNGGALITRIAHNEKYRIDAIVGVLP